MLTKYSSFSTHVCLSSVPWLNWPALVTRTSAQAASGAGCVFQTKIPSVQLSPVCKYSYRLMTTLRFSCTRGLNNSCLAVSVIPLSGEIPLIDGQHSRTGSILPSNPTLHLPRTHLSSLPKYLYLGQRNTAEATKDLINLLVSHSHTNLTKKRKLLACIGGWRDSTLALTPFMDRTLLTHWNFTDISSRIRAIISLLFALIRTL